MFLIRSRYSEAVEFISVNPLKATALVRYTSGGEYLYRGVSRRKLLNLMINDNMSLGFWVQQLSRDAVLYRGTSTGMTYELVGHSVSSRTLPVLLQQHKDTVAA
tara:strand:+ start:487 stop:798 length:312 start_codon:yes stop_codon:yes gene_type:complete